MRPDFAEPVAPPNAVAPYLIPGGKERILREEIAKLVKQRPGDLARIVRDYLHQDDEG
jgi:flagellar biosynthesis/type III secretory pathway M-ring protein FliF/YscJ